MAVGYHQAVALLPGVPVFENPLFDASWRDQLGEPAYSVARALRDDGFAEIDLVQPDFAALCGEIRAVLESGCWPPTTRCWRCCPGSTAATWSRSRP